jgi:hypothetical protein
MIPFKTTFTLLTVLFFSIKGISQTDIIKYQVFIRPLHLYYNEIYVGYEKVFNERISSSVLVSYKFATRNEEKLIKGWCIGGCGDYPLQNIANHHYNAVGIGIAPSFYYLIPNVYISPEFGYKYWWFDNKQVKFQSSPHTSFDVLRSDRSQDYCAKLSLGVTLEPRKWHFKNKSVIINVFGTLDYKYRQYSYESLGGTINDQPNIYQLEKNHLNILIPYFGCSFGLGVRDKNAK